MHCSFFALPFRLAAVLLAMWSIPLAVRGIGESATAPTTAMTPIEAEARPIADRIKNKIQAGAHTEVELADEIKALDAILAAHKGEQSEDLAQVLMLKTALYLQFFQDLDKSEILLKQIKADFPKTRIAPQVDGILAEIALHKEKQKIQAALVTGTVLPDFDEKDLAGKPLSIGKFKGKIVLVDFWATWCPPCLAELPNVIAAYKKYHDKGFEIVGISLDQDEAKLKSFIAEKGMTWQQYFDGKGWDSKLSQKYGIDSIPATFLLDRKGNIIAKGLDGPALEAELEKQLGK